MAEPSSGPARSAYTPYKEVGSNKSGRFQEVSLGSGGGRVLDFTVKSYVDAKVEGMKAQNDARFAEVLAGIDKIGASLSAHGEIVKDRLTSIDEELRVVKTSAQDAEKAAKGVKWNIVATALGMVALLFAMWAIWAQGVEMVAGLLGASSGGEN